MTALLAVLGVLAVVAGCAASILGLVSNARAARTGRQVQQISVQVDGRLSTLLERQAQLLAAMHEAGTPIPAKPPEPPPP
jgi:hypothetical protein